MQDYLRKITANSYILPLIVLAICIWRIFVPQLEANDGLGWDGYNYFSLTKDGLQSEVLNSYLVLRLFPCYFIHIIFTWFHIGFEPAHVILAFKIMGTGLIGIAGLMVKKIFEQYQLSPISQITGFVLVFLNYGVLQFTYFYPVMTDATAFFLCVALFYFFVRGELLNVFLIGLIGAFTWPILFAMAIALIIFPQTKIDFNPAPKAAVIVLGVLCAAYALGASYYFIFTQGLKADDMFTLPISAGMLPVSFLAVGVFYFLIVFILRNRAFFTLGYYRRQLNGGRIFGVVALLIIFVLLRTSIKTTAASQYLSYSTQIAITMVYALQRPLIGLISHFNYFGCAIALCIVFWKRITAFISTFGLGVAASIFVCLFLYFTQAESRRLIFFMPWVMILVALFLGQYQFSKWFYALIFLLNFGLAKLWLPLGDIQLNQHLLPDGTIAFPAQWFYMHLGRWMTQSVWLLLGVILGISLLLFFTLLYKIEFGKKAILFYARFEAVTVGDGGGR